MRMSHGRFEGRYKGVQGQKKHTAACYIKKKGFSMFFEQGKTSRKF